MSCSFKKELPWKTDFLCISNNNWPWYVRMIFKTDTCKGTELEEKKQKGFAFTSSPLTNLN